jgi:hypothetical protein
LAKFSVWIDFRLLQQYPPEAVVRFRIAFLPISRVHWDDAGVLGRGLFLGNPGDRRVRHSISLNTRMAIEHFLDFSYVGNSRVGHDK